LAGALDWEGALGAGCFAGAAGFALATGFAAAFFGFATTAALAAGFEGLADFLFDARFAAAMAEIHSPCG
jgi:hypothetical protein